MTLPSRDELNEAIHRIHEGRRSSWPDAQFLTMPDIDTGLMFAEVAGWTKLRWECVELIEDLVEGIVYAPSVEELDAIVERTLSEMAAMAEEVMRGIMENRAGETP